MTKEDNYKSPWKEKDATYATTVNNTFDDTGFTLLDSFQDDTSDSSKQVETSKKPTKDTQTIKEPIKDTQKIKEPITDDNHIVYRVRYLQYGPTNMDPVLTEVGIIEQGEPRTVEFTICVCPNSYGLAKAEICINTILSIILDR